MHREYNIPFRALSLPPLAFSFLMLLVNVSVADTKVTLSLALLLNG